MEAGAAASGSCPKDDHHDDDDYDDDCVFLESEDGEFLLPGDRIRSGADAVNTVCSRGCVIPPRRERVHTT